MIHWKDRLSRVRHPLWASAWRSPPWPPCWCSALWYPYPYREISGGRELFLLVVTVDVMLGPLITLAVFNRGQAAERAGARPGRSSGLIQLAALGYGLWTVAVARPVHLVFEFDRFRVVHAIDVPQELLGRQPAGLAGDALAGPHGAGGAALPRCRREVQRDHGRPARAAPVAARPDLWQPYAAARTRVIEASRPAEELKRRFPARAAEIDAALQRAGRAARRLAVPAAGRPQVFLDRPPRRANRRSHRLHSAGFILSLSHRSFRFAGAALVLALALPLAAPPVQAQLPTLGDGSDLDVSSERKLGERIARELYRDPDYIDDAILDEYVLGIWTRLLAAARARGELTAELDDRFAWQVLLGKDRVINAFAVPGGWMGLQLGLINVTATRDELASVLAHELSHVTQRHISRLMTQQSRQAPWLIGAMILGALAMGKSADAGNAMIAGGQALAMQNQLNFSRDMEREADRIGFGVMTQAGFEPQGFVTMFDKLQQAARLNDNGNFPYLRTHPMTTERIAEMQSRQQLAPRAAVPAPDAVHAMMVGRSRVLSNPGVDNLRAYAGEADGPQPAASGKAREAGLLYAAALASAKLREPAAAAKLAARLVTVTAGDAAASRLARLLAAEVALEAGDAPRAAGLVDAAAPGRPELILSSRARIGSGRAAEAAQRLQTWVALHPRDAAAWQLLSAAYAAQGANLRAIRADAEAQVAHLDYQAAMDRFKAAQDLARQAGAGGDHIEASIIDTRARQVASLLREQALER